jgi:hypothetical protein
MARGRYFVDEFEATAVLFRAGGRMTDLMASLASRTLGLTPVLQPGVTSMFAPRQHRVEREPSNLVTSSNAVWTSDLEALDAAEIDTEVTQDKEPVATGQTRPQPLVTTARSTLPLVRSPHAHLPRRQTTDVAESPIQSVEPNLLPDLPEAAISMERNSEETAPQTEQTPEQTSEQTSEQTPVQRSRLDLRASATLSTEHNTDRIAAPSLTNPAFSVNPLGQIAAQAEVPRSIPNALPSSAVSHQGVPASPQGSEPLDPVDGPSQSQSNSIQSSPNSQRSTPIQPVANLEKTATLLVQQDIQQNLESDLDENQQPKARSNQQIVKQELQHLAIAKVDRLMPAFETSVLPQSASDISMRERTIAPRSQDITPRSRERTTVDLPPPPTIQITIGRIDIRAVAAPPPTRSRPSSAPPKLSLDDYLKSRSRG